MAELGTNTDKLILHQHRNTNGEMVEPVAHPVDPPVDPVELPDELILRPHRNTNGKMVKSVAHPVESPVESPVDPPDELILHQHRNTNGEMVESVAHPVDPPVELPVASESNLTPKEAPCAMTTRNIEISFSARENHQLVTYIIDAIYYHLLSKVQNYAENSNKPILQAIIITYGLLQQAIARWDKDNKKTPAVSNDTLSIRDRAYYPDKLKLIVGYMSNRQMLRVSLLEYIGSYNDSTKNSWEIIRNSISNPPSLLELEKACDHAEDGAKSILIHVMSMMFECKSAKYVAVDVPLFPYTALLFVIRNLLCTRYALCKWEVDEPTKNLLYCTMMKSDRDTSFSTPQTIIHDPSLTDCYALNRALNKGIMKRLVELLHQKLREHLNLPETKMTRQPYYDIETPLLNSRLNTKFQRLEVIGKTYKFSCGIDAPNTTLHRVGSMKFDCLALCNNTLATLFIYLDLVAETMLIHQSKYYDDLQGLSVKDIFNKTPYLSEWLQTELKILVLQGIAILSQEDIGVATISR